MNYLQAWREGHEAGMSLSLQLINEFTGQDFKTSSEVVLFIKDLENQREADFYKPVKSKSTLDKEIFINALAEEIAIQNSMWSN